MPAQTLAQLAATLEKAAITTNDLGPGYVMKLQPDGAKVKGQATLEICGFKFNSETHRVLRRAYQAADQKTGDYVGLSNELVAYDSPASAQHALAEWEVAANTCPSGVVTSTDADVPPLSYTLIKAQNDMTSLPIKTNTMTSESASLADDSFTDYDLAILQVQGRFLDAIALDQEDPYSPTDIQIALKLAKATGQRLAPPIVAAA